MPVHINSVISAAISNFDFALYDTLTSKENYLYTNTPSGESDYKPFVLDLNAAILTWMGEDRQPKIEEVVIAIYSKDIMDNLYGAGGLPPGDSRTIFTMDGFRSRIKLDPLNYYEDFYVDMILGPQAPKLIADKNLIAGSYLSQETSAIGSLISTNRSGVSATVNTLLFEDLPQLNPPKTKQQVANDIFILLNWKEVYLGLNVGTLTLPSYI